MVKRHGGNYRIPTRRGKISLWELISRLAKVHKYTLAGVEQWRSTLANPNYLISSYGRLLLLNIYASGNWLPEGVKVVREKSIQEGLNIRDSNGKRTYLRRWDCIRDAFGIERQYELANFYEELMVLEEDELRGCITLEKRYVALLTRDVI
jgi:hypothetical protein